MAIALAPRMCILVGKTVGEIRNHHNIRGAIRDLCAMPYGDTGVEGLSGVGVPRHPVFELIALFSHILVQFCSNTSPALTSISSLIDKM